MLLVFLVMIKINLSEYIVCSVILGKGDLVVFVDSQRFCFYVLECKGVSELF